MRLWGGAEYGAAGQSAKDMAAVIRDPGSAARWAAGANGERVTALWLRPLTYTGWVILHDRSIPGLRANIDHIVIGPGGLFVVDSKMWRKTALRLDRGRLIREEIEVDFSTSMMETEMVSVALAIRARPVICVHGCRVPWRGYAVTTQRGGRVHVLNPRPLLAQLAQAPRHFSREKVARLSKIAQRSFPAYGPS